VKCQAGSHRWVYCGRLLLYPDDKTDHVCKDCNVTGVTCDKCNGYGEGIGNVSGCPPGNCPACNGEGVVALGEGE